VQELRRIRKERGLTQRGLADASGVDPATISLIETGKRRPHLETLDSLALVLGVEVVDLLGKAQAPLPLDFASAADGASLDPMLWRQHCESLAELFEDLAGRDVPPSRALGWWDVVPHVAGYVLAVVDALLEGVQDGTISDDEDELMPLLRAAYRLAYFADEVWVRGAQALAGEIEQAAAELQFWKITEGLELTDEQREQITA
jgi:transcriptional regulator with XRE-family HTH domain